MHYHFTVRAIRMSTENMIKQLLSETVYKFSGGIFIFQDKLVVTTLKTKEGVSTIYAYQTIQKMESHLKMGTTSYMVQNIRWIQANRQEWIAIYMKKR